jgi:hypothetical protein
MMVTMGITTPRAAANRLTGLEGLKAGTGYEIELSKT